jgi:hypothetical protein
MAASGQRRQSLESRSAALNDADLQCASSLGVAHIARAWAYLPPHIREAIQTLVDASLPTDQAAGPSVRNDPIYESVLREQTAWRIAKKCRCIVQTCLREEEWRDADREFFDVIITELEGRTDE